MSEETASRTPCSSPAALELTDQALELADPLPEGGVLGAGA